MVCSSRRTLLPPLVVACVALALVSCEADRVAPREEIVAGSTLLEDILNDLTGGTSTVGGLIPPGMCPGHYDLRPSDLERVARCKVFLLHPWQRRAANIQALIEGAKLPQERVEVVDVAGSWMVPEVHAEVVEAIAAILERCSAEAAPEAGRVAERVAAVKAHGEAIARRVEEASLPGLKVLCSDKQEELARWAKLDVVATYGRPEDLSVAEVERLIRVGRQAGVTLVIDNLQSGDTRTSMALAEELDAAQVTLSNFPGAFDGTETWEKAFARNIELLIEAVRRQP